MTAREQALEEAVSELLVSIVPIVFWQAMPEKRYLWTMEAKQAQRRGRTALKMQGELAPIHWDAYLAGRKFPGVPLP